MIEPHELPTLFSDLLHLVRTLKQEELLGFLGMLEQIRVTAYARLVNPVVPMPPDQRLEVPEAAHRLGVSPDYLYRHWQTMFPSLRKEGRKLLIPASLIAKYINRSC